MKKRLLLLFLLLAPPAAGAPSVRIREGEPLRFGRLTVSTAGSVVLDVNGSRSTTSGIFGLSSPVWGVASFTVMGKAGTPFTILLPAQVTVSDGRNSMTVTELASSPSGNGLIGNDGTVTLLVWGRLNVQSAQPAGSYTGSLSVTVY